MVATPLRLVALIREQCIDLSKVEVIVLDEADKLLDIDSHQRSNVGDDEDDEDAEPVLAGDENADEPARIRSSFLSQIDEVLSQCTNTSPSSSIATASNSPPKTLQRALFSATIGPFVRELASTFLVNPVQVTIGQENTGASSIQQQLVFVGREDGKLLAIRQLIQQGIQPPVLIFVQSIERAKALFQELIFDGINVDVIHANRSSHQREEILRKFRVGEVWVLICTDLLARGIDIYGVNMVINYDLPQSAISYIHRIGRTGRGGRQGKAITYFTEHDIPYLRSIANVVKLSGCEVPDWMLAIKPVSLFFSLSLSL
jgi:ATP-dependent RNA helicase DDX52/ROK1